MPALEFLPCDKAFLNTIAKVRGEISRTVFHTGNSGSSVIYCDWTAARGVGMVQLSKRYLPAMVTSGRATYRAGQLGHVQHVTSGDRLPRFTLNRLHSPVTDQSRRSRNSEPVISERRISID